jgi:hypothetical protein
MPDVSIVEVINLGLMPFVLYMAWMFWTALQRANEKHDIVIERLMEILQANTKALADSVAQGAALGAQLSEHDKRAFEIDDKIDLLNATTQGVHVRTMRIEELLKPRPASKAEKAL